MSVSSNILSRYRYSLILLRQLVATDFKLRYQGSVLGYVWSLLKPLALFTILYVVFVKLLGLGSGIPHYPVYLLLGIILWSFFTEVTGQCIGAIVGRGDLMRKLNFPRYVIVLSAAFSALINLILNLIVVGVFMALSRVPLSANIIYMPLLILELFVLSIGFGFLLSALYVKLRDLSHIWDVILQAAFYATPIIYPLSMIPADFRHFTKILMLNPMAQIIQDARYSLVTSQAETIGAIYNNQWVRLVPIVVVIIVALASAWYFRSRSIHFAEEV